MTNTIYLMNRGNSRRMAQKFAESVADGLVIEAGAAADYAVQLISTLRGAGAGSISIGAVKDALADAFSDCQGCINRTLDNENVEPDARHKLDLSEVEGA